MITNTFYPLVGEGWPKRDLSESAQNRNICGLSRSRFSHVLAGSSRTKHDHAGSVDAWLTQQTEFLFAECSAPLGNGARPECVLTVRELFRGRPSAADLDADDVAMGWITEEERIRRGYVRIIRDALDRARTGLTSHRVQKSHFVRGGW